MKKNYLIGLCGNSKHSHEKTDVRRIKNIFLVLLFYVLIVPIQLSAQTNQVSGTVRDNKGQPLPGVNVLVKGTTTGTATDIDGNFALNATSSDVLIVKFLGYVSQEVTVGTNSTLAITLKEEVLDMDEVIVVGYGVKKKSLSTAAISSVKADDLVNRPVSRADQAMQGKVAGVSVLSTSGSPGAGTKIRIRGTNSNGDSNPLFIVDGMKTGDINNIDPSDIESMEILKDAASAAIYGTEGSNGVIIITTKLGKEGASKITYDYQFALQSARSNVDMMNSSEYQTWMDETGDVTITLDDTSGDTDWLDEIYEVVPMQKHHVSFSGGTEKTSYLISTSYFTQNGVIGDDKAKYDRFTSRVNVKSKVKDWLEVGENFSYAQSKKKYIGEDSEYGSIVNCALLLDPTTPVVYDDHELYADRISELQDLEGEGYTILTNDNGDYYGLTEQALVEITNPVAQLTTYHNKITTDKFLGTAYATLKPIKGLSITSRLGIDLTYKTNHSWSGAYYYASDSYSNTTSVTDNIYKWYTWVWENFASYNFNIGAHNFSLLAGYSAEEYTYDYYYMTSGYLVEEGDKYAHQGYADSDDYDAVSGSYDNQTMTSVFSRLSYDFKDRYMFEASLRTDGASVFPSKNRFATFPALSVGWIASEESFFNVPFIDYTKLRISWGQNGSKSNLSGNQDVESWSFDASCIDSSGNSVSGAEVTSLTNEDLTWERTEQLDLGIDIRAFDGKVSLGMDYFHKVTKDLIVDGTGPSSVGADYPSVNGGDVTNKGFDLELAYRNYDHNFKYSINANLSILNNEVTNLASEYAISGDVLRTYELTWFEEGYPIWYFKGYKTDGIVSEDDITNNNLYADFEEGDPRVVDVDGDGDISSSDKTYIGDPHPDLLFGLTLNAQYKGFDMNVFVQGTQGNDVFMGWFRADRLASNKPKFLYDDRWTETNTNASMPAADNSSDYVYRSDLMVGDGSFVRIKQIQLGYNLPKNFLKRAGVIKSTRIYVSLDDYFTFTKYEGLDPEAGSSTDNRQGVDRGIYPVAGKVLFGLSVNF
jgi:TonB-linked SusC/RagA family outer membrane protein